LGEVPGPAERVTHGFCEECYRSELLAWTAFLDTVAVSGGPRPQSVAESAKA
jgi:hypothetical protein